MVRNLRQRRRTFRHERCRRIGLESLESRNLLAAQPVLVKDVDATVRSLQPQDLVVSHGRIYFSRLDRVAHVGEIWSSDGTGLGTVRLWQGGNIDDVRWLGSAGDHDFFRASGPGLARVMATLPGGSAVEVWSDTSTNATPAQLPGFHDDGQKYAYLVTAGTDRRPQLYRIDPSTLQTTSIPLDPAPILHPLAETPWAMASLGGKTYVAFEEAGVDATTAKQTIYEVDVNASTGSRVFERTASQNLVDGQVTFVRLGDSLLFNNSRLLLPLVLTAGKPFTEWMIDPGLRLWRMTTLGNGVIASQLYFYVVITSGADGLTVSPRTLMNATELKTIGWSGGGIISPAETGISRTTMVRIDIDEPPLVRTTKATQVQPWTSATPSEVVPLSDNLAVIGLDDPLVIDGVPLLGGVGQEIYVFADQTVRLLRDIAPGPESSRPAGLISWRGRVYFTADDGISGRELWSTDGKNDVNRVVDLNPGTGSGITVLNSAHIVSLGDWLYFVGSDGKSGWQLWRTDGTPGGTAVVSALPGPTQSALPQSLTSTGGKVYFSASDGSVGRELWTTDGTSDGTVLVKDIRSGPGSSQPRWLTPWGTRTFFAADDGQHGVELWATDGSTSGTALFADLQPGVGSSRPFNLTVSGNRLFFAASPDPAVPGNQLFATGGTADSLHLVSPSLAHLDNDWAGIELVPWKDQIAFVARASDAATDRGIWISDGTEAGTRQALPQIFVEAFREIGHLLVWHDALVFSTSFGLFRMSNVEEGPQLIVRWGAVTTAVGAPPLKGVRGITWIEAADDKLYIAVDSESLGTELLVSDGTAEGTFVLADLLAGPEGSNPTDLVHVGDTAYFVANQSDSHQRIWATRGVPGDLQAVTPELGRADIEPIDFLTPYDGYLYFAAYTPAQGREIWRTQGTPGSTEFVADLWPGMRGSMPVGLTPLPGGLLFTADSVEYGTEIWRIDPVRPSIYGDLDFDNDVDSVDLLLWLSNWTGSQSPGEGILTFSQGDSDLDGDIDSSDLLEFLAAWTGVTAATVMNQSPSIALDGLESGWNFHGTSAGGTNADESSELKLLDDAFADTEWPVAID